MFVAVWPTESVLSVLSGATLTSRTPELRWVPPTNWHVTLAFLGFVPDDEHHELVAALRSITPSASPCIATLGPETLVLGGHVLCVPVSGLDELARAVREYSAPFSRSADRDESFVGHLTLGRARRGRAVPHVVTGVAISTAWSVTEFRLVSSTTGPRGAEYSPTAFVRLDG